MTAEQSELYMWEDESSTNLHQMREYVLQSMSRAQLTVLIPRRTVKVPHTKSKKLQQLQAKPRDPNASPSLLMIAPPSDCRYFNLMKGEPPGIRSLDVGRQRQYRGYQSAEQVVGSIRTTPCEIVPPGLQPATQAWTLDRQTPINGTAPIPGPSYFQQLSTIAALAWSDSSQATEKLRQIYEHTSLLSRDQFSAMTQYASPYMTSSNVLSDIQKSQDYSRLSQNDSILYKQVEPEKYWEMPSIYCACAVCKMTKRTKSNMTSQRRNAVKLMTSNVNNRVPALKSDNHATRQPVMTNQVVAQLKRMRSPEITSLCQQPPSKMYRQENYSVPKLGSRDQVSGKGALFSYLKAKAKVPERSCCKVEPNIFFPPALQINTSSTNRNDLMMTPSFDNPCLVSSQIVNANGGFFNGFTNFLQPKILNALE